MTGIIKEALSSTGSIFPCEVVRSPVWAWLEVVTWAMTPDERQLGVAEEIPERLMVSHEVEFLGVAYEAFISAQEKLIDALVDHAEPMGPLL
jgi:hypothetical protein